MERKSAKVVIKIEKYRADSGHQLARSQACNQPTNQPNIRAEQSNSKNKSKKPQIQSYQITKLKALTQTK